MGNDIIAYIQKLELFGFFPGYCVIYAILFSLKTANTGKAQTLLKKITLLLPYSYALVATLYLGMVLKNISPDFSMKNVDAQFQLPFLQIFGLVAVLFWIPLFSKKPIFSLLHSLLFFSFLMWDFIVQFNSPAGKEIINNNMKVFTDSLLLNTIALSFVTLIHFSLIYFSESRKANS